MNQEQKNHSLISPLFEFVHWNNFFKIYSRPDLPLFLLETSKTGNHKTSSSIKKTAPQICALWVISIKNCLHDLGERGTIKRKLLENFSSYLCLEHSSNSFHAWSSCSILSGTVSHPLVCSFTISSAIGFTASIRFSWLWISFSILLCFFIRLWTPVRSRP